MIPETRVRVANITPHMILDFAAVLFGTMESLREEVEYSLQIGIQFAPLTE